MDREIRCLEKLSPGCAAFRAIETLTAASACAETAAFIASPSEMPTISQMLARREQGEDRRVIETASCPAPPAPQRWAHLHHQRRKPASVVAPSHGSSRRSPGRPPPLTNRSIMTPRPRPRAADLPSKRPTE